jgi:hypothetical protein
MHCSTAVEDALSNAKFAAWRKKRFGRWKIRGKKDLATSLAALGAALCLK